MVKSDLRRAVTITSSFFLQTSPMNLSLVIDKIKFTTQQIETIMRGRRIDEDALLSNAESMFVFFSDYNEEKLSLEILEATENQGAAGKIE